MKLIKRKRHHFLWYDMSNALDKRIKTKLTAKLWNDTAIPIHIILANIRLVVLNDIQGREGHGLRRILQIAQYYV